MFTYKCRIILFIGRKIDAGILRPEPFIGIRCRKDRTKTDAQTKFALIAYGKETLQLQGLSELT